MDSPFLNDDEFAKSAMTEGGSLLKARALPVGTTRDWKGKKYIKTAQGWKPKGKGVEKKLSEYSKDPDVAKAKKEREKILQSDEFGEKYGEQISTAIIEGIDKGNIKITQSMMNYGMEGMGLKADVMKKRFEITQSILKQMIEGDLKEGEIGDLTAENAVGEIRNHIEDGLITDEISDNRADTIKTRLMSKIVNEIRKKKEGKKGKYTLQDGKDKQESNIKKYEKLLNKLKQIDKNKSKEN